MRLTLLYLLLFCSVAIRAQNRSSAAVYFDLNKSELSADACHVLDQVASELKAAPDYELGIDGFTDNSGTEGYNQKLADERVSVVRQYLVNKGVVYEKTDGKGWGERNLKYDNDSETSRQKNRRVDLTLQTWYFKDLSELQQRMRAPGEETLHFTGDAEQTLTTRQGVTVVVPANSFVFEDGTPATGPIELTVREALSPSDWLLNNLSTLSGDKILQSGGMLCISAQSGGRKLNIGEGADLTVAIPTRNKRIDPEMQLFYGNHNPDSTVNWQASRKTFRRKLDKGARVYLEMTPELAAELAAIQVQVPVKPAFPSVNGVMPPEPVMAEAPIKPRPALRPDFVKIQAQYAKNGHLNARRMKKTQANYNLQMLAFQRDSVLYERNMVKYAEKMKVYTADYASFSQKHDAWMAEAERRYKLAAEFDQKAEHYEYSKALSQTLHSFDKAKPVRFRNLEEMIDDKVQRRMNYWTLTVNDALSRKGAISTRSSYLRVFGKDFMEHQFRSFNRRCDNQLTDTSVDSLENKDENKLALQKIETIKDSLLTVLRDKELASGLSNEDKQQVLNAYVADINQLGWINVDRFYHVEGERVPLIVNEQEDVNMYIYCRDINSMLPVYRQNDGMFQINMLPKGMKVTVISVKIKDGRPEMSTQDAVVGQRDPVQMQYRAYTLRELRTEMLKLNG